MFNRKLNEMDLIWHAMNLKEKLANERLHDEYRKIFKYDRYIIYSDKEKPTISILDF